MVVPLFDERRPKDRVVYPGWLERRGAPTWLERRIALAVVWTLKEALKLGLAALLALALWRLSRGCSREVETSFVLAAIYVVPWAIFLGSTLFEWIQWSTNVPPKDDDHLPFPPDDLDGGGLGGGADGLGGGGDGAADGL